MRLSFIAGVAILCGCLSTLLVQAQCNDRYQQEVFEEVMVETVTYSEEHDLQMDIYQPVGDDFARRPVILFAHGGSFFAGSKNNPSMGTLCTTFAKRGYVTASYNYNLTSNLFALLDSLTMIEVVMQAVSDGKAAVRYFRQDAANDNNYRIDTDQVFTGGNSAGAVLALHLAYIDDLSETPDYMASIIEDAGGLEGNSGNFGYSSEVKGVISLAGGINKLGFIDANDEPVVSCHGDSDGTVPYNCDDVFSGNPITAAFDMVDLCGAGNFHPYAEDVGVNSALLTFEGDDHTPWEFSEEKMDQVIQFVSDFIHPLVECDDATIVGVEELSMDMINVYPNPASDFLIVDATVLSTDAELFLNDNLGRIHRRTIAIAGQKNKLDVSNLPVGIYHLKLHSKHGVFYQQILID